MPRKSTTNRTKLPAIKQLPSGAYHAQVYEGTDPHGKRLYRSFTSHDYNQLLLDLAQFKKEKKDKKISASLGKRSLTVGEAFDRYIESKDAVLSPATIAGYRSARRNNLKSIMSLHIDELTQDDVQRAINVESLDHSPKSVRNTHGLLAAVLQTYRPEFTLHTRLPQKIKNEIAIPTEDEIKHLVELSMDTPMQIPILLAACCGMRRSEIAALTWDCIDFDKNTITVRRALVMNEDNELVEKTTKTTAGTRTIRMFPVVSNALMMYKSTSESTDGYITIPPDHISHGFERLRKKAGLPAYRFHDLRHYTVSVMLSLNIPKNYIADYVGHETDNMIDKVYGHIMKSKKTSVEDLMQEYYKNIF